MFGKFVPLQVGWGGKNGAAQIAAVSHPFVLRQLVPAKSQINKSQIKNVKVLQIILY